MAGEQLLNSKTKYYTKRDLRENINWLWIVGQGYSLLVEWDQHYLGPEIYSLTILQGEQDFTSKKYREVRQFEIMEILKKIQRGFLGLCGAIVQPRAFSLSA